MDRVGTAGRKRNAAGVSLLAREQTADSGDGQLVRVGRARLQRRRQIFTARLGARFQSNFWRRGVREHLPRHGTRLFSDALEGNRKPARAKE